MFGTRRRPHRRLVLQITISGHASNYESKGPSFLLSLGGSKSSSLVVEERGENGAASQQQQDKGRRRHCTDTTTMHMHRRRATTEVTWHSSMGMRPRALARPWLGPNPFIHPSVLFCAIFFNMRGSRDLSLSANRVLISYPCERRNSVSKHERGDLS